MSDVIQPQEMDKLVELLQYNKFGFLSKEECERAVVLISKGLETHFNINRKTSA